MKLISEEILGGRCCTTHHWTGTNSTFYVVRSVDHFSHFLISHDVTPDPRCSHDLGRGRGQPSRSALASVFRPIASKLILLFQTTRWPETRRGAPSSSGTSLATTSFPIHGPCLTTTSSNPTESPRQPRPKECHRRY